MTHKMEGASSTGGSQEKRKEERYSVPYANKQNIKLQVKSGNEFMPATLVNVSRDGILFECPVSFSRGMQTECLLSIALPRSRELSFVIEVRYCYEDNGSHITGASIVSISDEIWFDIFVEIHDLIVPSKGSA